ncbi:MAG TPA: DUF1178 family protein [Azospirillaceae bacterium]|nr:DUF1178 family protein [Azospirillaceae bacterium]
MILYELRCAVGHHFEVWFKNGAAYEAQATAGEIVCPVCGDTAIGKAPMAPRIAKGRAAEERAVRLQGEVMRQLAELRRKVETGCDYVGERFADEARRIHYGEVDPRGIYGEATAEEAEELREEGVDFAKIPWVPRTSS